MMTMTETPLRLLGSELHPAIVGSMVLGVPVPVVDPLLAMDGEMVHLDELSKAIRAFCSRHQDFAEARLTWVRAGADVPDSEPFAVFAVMADGRPGQVLLCAVTPEGKVSTFVPMSGVTLTGTMTALMRLSTM